MKNQRIAAAVITLVTAVILVAVKFYAYWLTSSKAIYSDALEGIVNIISGLTLTSVIYYASKPADKDHPYGHGKIEYIASAFEGGAVLFAGILIFFDAFSALQSHSRLNHLGAGIWLTFAAGAVNGGLGFLLQYLGKKNHSMALSSSGTHLLSDFWTTLGVIIGLGLVALTGIHWVDHVVAILVALHLMWAGVGILRHSGSELMDAEDRGLLQTVVQLFNQHNSPGIIHIHSTRVMRSGSFHHIEAHVVVPEYWNVKDSHAYVDVFEKKLINNYPTDAEFSYHLDPCLKKYCDSCQMSDCPIRASSFKIATTLTIEDVIKNDEEI